MDEVLRRVFADTTRSKSRDVLGLGSQTIDTVPFGYTDVCRCAIEMLAPRAAFDFFIVGMASARRVDGQRDAA